MFRALLALGCAALAATAGHADLGPPRPTRTVPLAHRVTTDKDYPDHAFFLAALDGPTRTVTKVVAVKLGTKTPLDIPGATKATDVNREVVLVAVPKESLKGYATEKAFLQALVKGAVEGQVQTKVPFSSVTTVPVTDRSDKQVGEWKLERIDKGEVVVIFNDSPRPGPKKGGFGGKDGPDDESEESTAAPGVTAYTPKSGAWVAGLSAALAVALGGLWAVGRARRKL